MKLKTKPQKLTALPPASELGARFCQWFKHPWHWIYAEVPEPGKKAQWFTENRYPLRPRNLWQEYLDPETIIGLRFDNYETRYCLLDLDRGSPYHPANDRDRFKAVLAALEAIGLCRPLLVRSSDSEGIHIYYFLPEAAPTFALACAIRFALEDAGCYLRSGHLEAFPKCKPYSKGIPTDYNGHRLPLQVGSYWLDSDGLPLGDDLGRFLNAADVAAANQDLAVLRKAIAAALKSRRRLQYTAGVSNKAAEWKRHLEERIALGWTGRGQTNELLLDFATYGIVFLSLSDDALINYIVETAKTTPGYQQYCGHQHNIHRRATDWAKSAQKWYSPYRSYPKRDRSYQENFEQLNNIVSFENPANANRRQEAAERIGQAMAHLRANDMLPLGVTVRAAAILATVEELTGTKMSRATLYQSCHLSLWHPEHQQIAETFSGSESTGCFEARLCVESLEPAQGARVQAVSLYEGVGRDERLPQPLQSVGREALIQPTENQGGESEGGDLPLVTAPAAPTAPEATAPTALEATATPPTTAATAPAAPVLKSVLAAGALPSDICRLTKAWQRAKQQAEKFVRMQGLSEIRQFSPNERSRLETVAMWRFLWQSGEPEWMEEVKRHPEVLPTLFDDVWWR